MGLQSQRKGKSGELELSNFFNGRGYNTHRGKSMSYGTEPDIVGLPGVHCEVKRVERLDLSAAIAQAVRDAGRFKDGVPAVFHRKNREGWLVTMRLDDWMKLYEGEKMLNQITLLGRLVQDPELRQTPANIPVTSFTIAVDRNSKEKITDFIDCTAWKSTAEYISNYGAKGRLVIVTGSLQIREWTDKSGNKRRNAEVIVNSLYFCDRSRAGESSNNDDEDIPF